MSFPDLFASRFPAAFGTLHVEHAEGARSMRIVSATVSGLEAHALVQVVEHGPAGEPVDVAEAEVFLGRRSADAWPDGWSGAMDGAVHALRDAIALWLPKLSGPPSSLIHDAWPPIAVLDLLGLWHREGPAPERPQRFEGAEAIAQRMADRIDVRSDAGVDVPNARAVLAIDGWRWVVAVERSGGLVIGGALVLISPEGERATVVESGIDAAQSVTSIPFDGDTVTMRSVVEILILAMLLSDQDVPLVAERDDEDDEDDEMGLPFDGDVHLSQHLLFRDGERPLVDHRLQGDSMGEGPLRDGHVPELRARHPRVAALFDRFVREQIDPSYVARASSPR